jgi:hypothetical protein
MLRFALLGRRVLPVLRRQHVLVVTTPSSSFPRFLTSSLPLKDAEKTEEAAVATDDNSSKQQKPKTGGGGMGGMTAQETDDWLSELE